MMKRYYCLFILLFVFSCKDKPNINPIYWDFETDLEENNLFGKVKEVETYIISSIEKSILYSRMTFSKFGNITTSEFFKENGESIRFILNNYNQDNQIIKTHTKSADLNMTEIIKYDTLSKVKNSFIKVNDTIDIAVISNCDDKNRVIKEIEINKLDTIFRSYNYEYNNENKIILEEEIETAKGIQSDSFRKYEIDSNGNTILFQYKNQFLNIINESTYSSENKITQIKNYFIAQDEIKELKTIYKFDDFFNKITEKHFENGKLIVEKRNKYKIDKNGNWYEKSSFVKKVRVEKTIRKIKYWQ